MGKNGFISMTTILTIIVAVSAILIVNIDLKMQKNNLLNKIKDDVRASIRNYEIPNCVWSGETTMVKPESKVASNTIYISCTHVDKVYSLVAKSDLENIENVNNFFLIDSNLNVDFVRMYEINGGFKVVLGLSSSVLNDPDNGDDYTISLKENIFCVNEVCNEEIKSNSIKVVKEV